MSERPDATTSPAPDVPRARAMGGWPKASRWALAVVGVIAMIDGGSQIYKVFFPGLPGCASESTNATIHEIFKKKSVELTGLTEMKSITDTSTEKTCQANFLTSAETGTIYYRIYWQDKSPRVLITKVDTHPR